MTGMLSLFTPGTWFTGPALANAVVALLSLWWLGVVLLTLRAREQTDGA